jgi:membrane protease subunit HflK
MLEVIPQLGSKYIIDSDQQNLLPFLNMGVSGQGLVSPDNLLQKGE